VTGVLSKNAATSELNPVLGMGAISCCFFLLSFDTWCSLKNWKSWCLNLKRL